MIDRVALFDTGLAQSLEPVVPLAVPAEDAGATPGAVSAKDSWRALTLAELTRESIRDALCAAF
jgi:hypothetical protein